jgi:hypothetical protein
MRVIITSMIICFIVTLDVYVASGSDKSEGKSMQRDDLLYVEIPNESRLSIRTSISSLKQPQTSEIWLDCHPKDSGGKEPTIWSTELGTIDYVPANKYYYALVKVMEDRVFIFFVWDGRYFILDKKTGKILTKGKGDDTLKAYTALIPLKLWLRLPSTGRTMTHQEAEELERWKADPKRRGH